MSTVQQKQQNHKTYKETGAYSPFKGKKITGIVPEKDLMVDLLNKDFKATAFIKDALKN